MNALVLRIMCQVAAATLVAVWPSVAGAAPRYYVEASRLAVVRIDHDGEAEALERLDRGDQRVCQADDGQPLQEERYYRIILPDGREGWVSRYTVRVHEGTPSSARWARS